MILHSGSFLFAIMFFATEAGAENDKESRIRNWYAIHFPQLFRVLSI